MGISQKDIKLLWGRAANRCSLCQREVSEDKLHADGSFITGEQAHIVGEKEDAARGTSILTQEERDSYHNLILLCSHCHTKIDKNEEDYPVEKLHILKSKHELQVREAMEALNTNLVPMLSFADMLQLVEKLKPLLRYLHKSVPETEAKAFLDVLQIFWYSATTVTDQLSKWLPHTLDLILRPISCDEVDFRRDWHYGCAKLMDADAALVQYFADHSISWPATAHKDDYFNSVRNISANLSARINVEEQDKLLPRVDLEVLRHLLLICNYSLEFLRAGKHFSISEVFTRQFFKVIDTILKDVYHLTLPDALDEYKMHIINSLYRSEEWF
jgi:hypothetical protein